MAYCMNCGKEYPDSEEYCPYCGIKKGETGLHAKTVKNEKGSIPKASEYRPISMWGYIGYELLFLIPVAGFILMIVLSIVPENRNVKNFARSCILWLIIAIVIAVILIHAGVFAALDY